jgi:hypothetical protein
MFACTLRKKCFEQTFSRQFSARVQASFSYLPEERIKKRNGIKQELSKK